MFKIIILFYMNLISRIIITIFNIFRQYVTNA